MLWGFKKFWDAGHSGLSLSAAICIISSCPGPCCVCAVHLHLRAVMGTQTQSGQKTKSHWNQLCLLKESLCRAFSLLWHGTGGGGQSVFPLEKAPLEFWGFFIFYINCIIFFESSLNQTRKYSQSRTWMLFPAVRETFFPQCSCLGTVVDGILSMWNSLRGTHEDDVGCSERNVCHLLCITS